MQRYTIRLRKRLVLAAAAGLAWWSEETVRLLVEEDS